MSFFESKLGLEQKKELKQKVLLTRPVNIEFEKHVFSFYQKLVKLLLSMNEEQTTLAEDLDLLLVAPDRPKISFELKMAVLYRSEPKIFFTHSFI